MIEAENFDQGGNNISWFDTDDINEGGEYRSTGVDIEVTNDVAAVINRSCRAAVIEPVEDRHTTILPQNRP